MHQVGTSPFIYIYDARSHLHKYRNNVLKISKMTWWKRKRLKETSSWRRWCQPHNQCRHYGLISTRREAALCSGTTLHSTPQKIRNTEINTRGFSSRAMNTLRNVHSVTKRGISRKQSTRGKNVLATCHFYSVRMTMHYPPSAIKREGSPKLDVFLIGQKRA